MQVVLRCQTPAQRWSVAALRGLTAAMTQSPALTTQGFLRDEALRLTRGVQVEKHPPTRDCFFNLPEFRAEPLFASLLMFRPVFPLAVRNGVTPSRFIFLLFKAKGRSLKMHANGDNVQLNSKHLL